MPFPPNTPAPYQSHVRVKKTLSHPDLRRMTPFPSCSHVMFLCFGCTLRHQSLVHTPHACTGTRNQPPEQERIKEDRILTSSMFKIKEQNVFIHIRTAYLYIKLTYCYYDSSWLFPLSRPSHVINSEIDSHPAGIQ